MMMMMMMWSTFLHILWSRFSSPNRNPALQLRNVLQTNTFISFVKEGEGEGKGEEKPDRGMHQFLRQFSTNPRRNEMWLRSTCHHREEGTL
jgi:hypothetical protein